MSSERKIRFVNDSIKDCLQVNGNLISGYQHLPIVSLEQSVEKIVPFVPDVKNLVNRATEHCRKGPRLSDNESAAIYLYTMETSFYKILNQALRAKNPQSLEPWLMFLKLFISALDKLPSLPIIVWQGITDNFHGSHFVKDQMYTWSSINSCSSDVNVARLYVGPGGILFCINAIHGKDITEYSEFQGERNYSYAWNSFASSICIIRRAWLQYCSTKRMVSQHEMALKLITTVRH